jgi:hypothetical protein
MIDTLVYTFSKKFSTPENLDRIVELYTETYLSNKRIHSVKLYTDAESYYLFENNFETIVTADTQNLILLDDLKLSVLPLLSENELLFDGDIFLEHPLSLNTEKDVICERITVFSGSPYTAMRYIPVADLYINNGIKNVIPFFNNGVQWVPNIGMLYFNNKNAQSEYLTNYYLMRNWFIDNNIESLYGLMNSDIRNYATIGQYVLGLICEQNSYTIEGFKSNNSYTHLAGPIKYADNLVYDFFKNKVVNI